MLLKKSEVEKKNRDQEMCFFFLFRFIELIAFFKNKVKDPKYLKAFFGSKAMWAIKELEEMDTQLEDR